MFHFQLYLASFQLKCFVEGRRKEAKAGIWGTKQEEKSSHPPSHPSPSLRWSVAFWLGWAQHGLSKQLSAGFVVDEWQCTLNAQPVSVRVVRHPEALLPAHLQNIFGFAAAAAKSGGDGLWMLPTQCFQPPSWFFV